MKTVIDYANNPAPNHAAVEDIKDYFGERYDKIAAELKQVTDTDQFMALCSRGGVKGFPVRAWYDHFHGEGTFAKAFKL
jgi:hypothetical protein